METVIDRIAVQSQPPLKPAVPISNQLRLVVDNKPDLDEMILAEQGQGWVLISRGYLTSVRTLFLLVPVPSQRDSNSRQRRRRSISSSCDNSGREKTSWASADRTGELHE